MAASSPNSSVSQRPLASTSFDASNTDKNTVNELAYELAAAELDETLWDQRKTIVSLSKHHLGLNSYDVCTVLPRRQWVHGAFNLTIPINVTSGTSSPRSYLFRCAMPHKLAEAPYPGTVDEKLGSEAATYMWMQRHCADVRIPFLHGFGFSSNHHFTHEDYRPWYIRLARIFQRYYNQLLGYPDLSPYAVNPISAYLPTAYMLLEHVGSELGQPLSNVWDEERRDDSTCRKNLFQGMARIMLSLARIPQPRIGSFQLQDDCTVTLTNRPLTSSMMIFENEGTPRTMQTTDTFVSTESFVSDMITLHDNHFLQNPNAIDDEEDCRDQMAIKAMLRTFSHHYIKRDQRSGPFMLQLSDFQASSILVDEKCNVTCLTDLEWVCSLPVEMLSVPYWLTGQDIDEMEEEDLDEFDLLRQEFMGIFKEEEQKIALEHGIMLSSVMNDMWQSKGVWYWRCLDSATAMLSLLEDHICPRFSIHLSPKIGEVISKLWCENPDKVVAKKVADVTKYREDLRSVLRT